VSLSWPQSSSQTGCSTVTDDGDGDDDGDDVGDRGDALGDKFFCASTQQGVNLY